MKQDTAYGIHTIVSEKAVIASNVVIGHNCIIEDDVTIGDDTYIDNHAIIKSGTVIGKHGFVGANSIIGEHQMDFIMDRKTHSHELWIGDDSVIRSGSILYTGSKIGHHFQTGHNVTIRENSTIGNHVSLGTLTDVQGDCQIGHYVRAHSNVHIAQHAILDSFIWLFPYVVFTNDIAPPSDEIAGVYICSFAVVATRSVVLPGRVIGQDAMVGAGSVVTKDVAPYTLVSGNPAKKISDVRQMNKIIGKNIYPWRDNFAARMPWEESGFEKWYESLTPEDKNQYGIEKLL